METNTWFMVAESTHLGFQQHVGVNLNLEVSKILQSGLCNQYFYVARMFALIIVFTHPY